MRAKTFVVKTMNGSCVSPKIAGMESNANSRSVLPIARNTTTSGVKTRLPSSTVRSRPPSYRVPSGRTRRSARTARFSWYSSGSSPPATSLIAVYTRNAPNR